MANIKHTKEILEAAAKESRSISQVLFRLGLKWNGGTHSHIRRRLVAYGIDTSHFKGQRWNSGPEHKGGIARRTAENTLLERSSGIRTKTHLLRRALLECGIPHVCKCGLTVTWEGRGLTLEINHKNGNCLDDRLANLEFLCPNCHSQIPTRRPKSP